MNITLLEKHITSMLAEGLELDLSDPNLSDTPKRIARMYAEEFFVNIGKEFDNFTLFPNKQNYDQLIISEEINFVSVCSHHFLPFHGRAYLGYLPGDFVAGLSKLSRLVCHYAARPQLQENLTHEVIERFVECVQPLGAMLVIRAYHSCQSMRGARQSAALMTTSAVYGVMRSSEKARQEMMSAIYNSK